MWISGADLFPSGVCHDKNLQKWSSSVCSAFLWWYSRTQKKNRPAWLKKNNISIKPCVARKTWEQLQQETVDTTKKGLWPFGPRLCWSSFNWNCHDEPLCLENRNTYSCAIDFPLRLFAKQPTEDTVGKRMQPTWATGIIAVQCTDRCIKCEPQLPADIETKKFAQWWCCSNTGKKNAHHRASWTAETKKRGFGGSSPCKKTIHFTATIVTEADRTCGATGLLDQRKQKKNMIWWKKDLFAEWNRLGKLSEHHADIRKRLFAASNHSTDQGLSKQMRKDCDWWKLAGLTMRLTTKSCRRRFSIEFLHYELSAAVLQKDAALGWIAKT